MAGTGCASYAAKDAVALSDPSERLRPLESLPPTDYRSLSGRHRGSRQLLFDDDRVAACVVKDGHDSGADVGRRLRNTTPLLVSRACSAWMSSMEN